MDFQETLELAAGLPETLGPLVADIDGTLTDDQRALDPRVLPVLRAWPEAVVIATGKAMPYPVALAEFAGLEPNVIAENGGVALAGYDHPVRFTGDPEAATAVVEEYRDRGYSLGWGETDLVNRWRETEIAVSRDSPLDPLESIAAEHGLVVVDTGYAYHVKSPDQSKGRALEAISDDLGVSPEECLAVGDSTNDVSTFEVAGRSVAVGNADEDAKAAADRVTSATFGDGFLRAVEWFLGREPEA
ncbi:phosphoglycolate phosphatase [Halovenus sp. WSH3]|uniref:Phosphoglycolate phosphatase n=1 Tax=Halovenus carboxidivorans TaxID=2692199 RepID=A0A6B0T601_9EURY|nr:phosphoglycolate phosphatase [Halovenus carboxidivorans]MXR52347.1 phosphoglycolate phosphatase [Halovenus carboxidivorans]